MEMYLPATEEVDMTKTMEPDRLVRVWAAETHNRRRRAIVTDLWLYGIADERPVNDIQREVDSLGPEHCEDMTCQRADTHLAH